MPVLNVALPRPREASRLDSGTHCTLPDLLRALNVGCHVMLVGLVGTGKSLMAVHTA
jgi:MoxR-like ATPase